MSDRKTGRTTRQMNEAPSGAWFVCPGKPWFEDLARRLARTDLVIVTPQWLAKRENWMGQDGAGSDLGSLRV